jgi:hypothetical protein
MTYNRFKRLRKKADSIYAKRTDAIRNGNMKQAARLRIKWQAAHNTVLDAWEAYRSVK